jgi:hypothetical protein
MVFLAFTNTVSAITADVSMEHASLLNVNDIKNPMKFGKFRVEMKYRIFAIVENHYKLRVYRCKNVLSVAYVNTKMIVHQCLAFKKFLKPSNSINIGPTDIIPMYDEFWKK